MINSKKLLHLAKKRRMAAAEAERKMISFHRTSSKKNPGDSHDGMVGKKGHFSIYTTDGRRFQVPMSYLAGEVIRELFALAKEEFGIPGDGPIVLPINASAMERVMSMIRQGLGSEQKKALLESLSRCSRSYFIANEARACPQITCT